MAKVNKLAKIPKILIIGSHEIIKAKSTLPLVLSL